MTLRRHTQKTQFRLMQIGLIRSKGFTLAELLITLLILAEIATFSIPKIIYAQQSAQRTAVFKETIAAAQAIMGQNYIVGNIQPGGTLNGSYILNNMNALKVCSSNAQSQGCWTQTLSGSTSGESGEPGLLLPNGASIIGLNDTAQSAPHGYNGMAIDWNGAAGPNIEGDDQIELTMCWEATPCWGGEIKNGSISPRTNATTSYPMYISLFN